MIINNLEEAKEFLPSVNLTVETNKINDFFGRAQEWLVKRIIGKDIESQLEADIQQSTEDEHAELRLLVKRIIAEQAYLSASSELDVQLSEAGFVVQSNDYMKPAFDGRVERLTESLRMRVKYDCDCLVGLLMTESTGQKRYAEWRGTEQFAYITQAFTPFSTMIEDAEEASVKMYSIFLMMQPRMWEGLKTITAQYVSREEILRLLELYRDDEILFTHKEAIDFIRKSGIAYARGDMHRAKDMASKARTYMKSFISYFPQFEASAEYAEQTYDINHGSIANFL